MSELVHTPHQGRSRETLTRILEAAETLMAQKPFEKITVAELVKEAKTTTGSFYARFEDKTSLLTVLHEQHLAEMSERIDEQVDVISKQAPRVRIRRIVEIMSDEFRIRPALMRSGTLHFWNQTKGPKEMEESAIRYKTYRDDLLGLLEKTAKELGNKNPKKASNFILKVLLSSSRQHYLFTDERTILKVDPEEFKEDQISMAYAYLKYGE